MHFNEMSLEMIWYLFSLKAGQKEIDEKFKTFEFNFVQNIVLGRRYSTEKYPISMRQDLWML